MQCLQCFKHFESSQGLKNHKVVHRKPWPCDQCSKRFRKNKCLEDHKKDVHGFPCDQCSKRFLSIQSLEGHRKTAHGFCDQCSNFFGSSQSLKDHEIRVHGVSCGQCSKRFRSNHGLEDHKRDVHGLPCDQCARRFGSSQAVADHKKLVHRLHASGQQDSDTLRATYFEFKIFCLCKRGADINKYISQHQPDEEYRRECSDVVDRVASFFKERIPEFKVNRFIKGGSLGKGTAIKSKSDIDCVMFTSNLPPIDSPDYKDQLQLHLKWVEDKLKRSSSSISFEFNVVGRTSHAVKLRVKTQKRGHESHDVDLLLAPDLLGECPTQGKKDEVYAMMDKMSPGARENCSAALVELQRDFVKKQPVEVKNLIRLVKMWKANCVTEKSLTSYPLELLCIHTWRSDMTVTAAFEAVLRQLSDYRNICAFWTDNYSTAATEIVDKRPLILDPANPFNNVADRCRDWDAVARAAQRILWKPFPSTKNHPSD